METGIYFIGEKTVIVAKVSAGTLIYNFFDKSDLYRTISKPSEELIEKEVFGKAKFSKWAGLERIIDWV